MPRLLSDSDGFDWITRFEPVSGPNARNSGSTTAMDGTEQTFDAYGDVVALQFTLSIKQGRMARRQAGLLTALRTGNAMRVRFFDPDMLTPSEAGIVGVEGKGWSNLPAPYWSNGQPWSSGFGWQLSAPIVPVTSSAALDTGVVSLADEFWGHSLGLGDRIGFLPLHFGLYTVTEVISPGIYRIWPRLRKATTADDFATLFPVIAMRPNIGTLPPGRGVSVTDEVSVTLVEVPDYYVRDYFED